MDDPSLLVNLVSIPIAVNLLTGFTQQVIVDFRDRLKERTDSELSDMENARTLISRVMGKITESFEQLQTADTDLEPLNELLKDEIFLHEVARDLMDGKLAAPKFADRIRAGTFGPVLHSKIDSLSEFFVEALKMSIANDNAVAHRFTHEQVRHVREELGSGIQSLDEKIKDSTSLVLEEFKSFRQLLGMSGIGVSRQAAVNQASVMAAPEPSSLNALNLARFNRAKIELETGSAVRAQYDFEGIVEDLKAAMSDPELLFRALSNLGIAHIRQGHVQEATSKWEEAYQLKPELPKAKVNHAMGLVLLLDFQRAETLLRDTLIQEPNSWEAIGVYACLKAARDGPADAVSLLQEHPHASAEYFSQLSQLLVRVERYEEALAAANKALKLRSDMETALASKSASIANPIIFRDTSHGSPHFTLSQAQRDQLLEAISLLKQAIHGLKARSEAIDLAVHYGNLSAYLNAAGNYEQGEEAGNLAVQRAPKDVGALSNLFIAQMHLDKFEDAAQTARVLCDSGWVKEGAVRLLDALVWNKSYGQVINEYDRLEKLDPEAVHDSYCESVRARALFGLPQTEKALEFIDEVISRHPNDATPLLEKGSFCEQLRQIADARKCYDKAEKTVSGPSAVLLQTQVGTFYFRNELWEEALRRFSLPQVDLLASPFAVEASICLFKIGRFKECLEVTQRYIAQNGYHEAVCSLAGHSQIYFGNLPVAIKYFEELVQKANDVRYWIILAQLHFRLDQKDIAESLLKRARLVHPDSREIPLLLSGLRMAQNDVEGALEVALEGKKLAPFDLATNQAVANAAILLPDGKSLDAKTNQSVRESITFVLSRPESGLMSVPLEPDLKTMRRMLRKRHKIITKVLAQYNANNLPQSILVKVLGHEPFDLWNGLRNNADQKIFVSDGSLEERERELAIAHVKEIVIDITALFSLEYVGATSLLTRVFEKVHVPLAVFESIKKQADMARIGKQPSVVMSYHEGQILHQELPPETAEFKRQFLENILLGLKQLSSPEGIPPELAQLDHIAKWKETMPASHADAFLLGTHKNIPVLVDDLGAKRVAEHELQTKCFSVQILLAIAVERGALSITEYDSAIGKLLKAGYAFIGDSLGTLIREFESNGNQVTPLGEMLLSRTSDPKIMTPKSGEILANFLSYAWIRFNKEQRSAVLDVARKNFLTPLVVKKGIVSFIVTLAASLVHFPATYFGIIFELFNDSLPARTRRTCIAFAFVGARVTAKNLDGFRLLQEQWLKHRRAAAVLSIVLEDRIGTIDLSFSDF